MNGTARNPFARSILVLAAWSVAMLPAAALPAALAGLSSSGRLEVALDAVRGDNIRSDEFFIASDELGGRDTPSLGLRVAARYIRARLERLGWQPGAEDGYFFRFPVEQRKLDEAASKVEWKRGDDTVEMRYGTDYFLTSTFDLKDLSTSGGVVFCGAAGTVDFAKSGVSGKWALCHDDGAEIRKLRGPAQQAGAIGLICAPGPSYSGEPYEKRFAKDLERQRRGSVFPRRRAAEGEPGNETRKNEPRDDQIPALMMSGGAAARIVGPAGVPPGIPAPGTDLGGTLTEIRKAAGQVEIENVCGLWPGSDPELAKEVIIVTAHYDHVGTRTGVVYNGADDNGSGTCGLMAIAEALASYGSMRRSVMLMWLAGEEKGLWGSAAWTKDPWLPGDAKPYCNINIDMIGRNAPDKLLITPTKALKQYNGLVRIAEKVAPLEGFPTLGSCDEYWARSDHKNFAENLKIPVTFLFSDIHEDYHQPGDKPEKVDIDKIRRVSRMVVRMLEELQADRVEF